MRLHKEGRLIIPIAFAILAGLWATIFFPFLKGTEVWWVGIILGMAGLIFFGFILNFFRDPFINVTPDINSVLAPADGKVVVIEQVHEPTYFHKPMTQISIFMSPVNVHVNRNPIGGKVLFHKYSPGKYLVAWHPKSSTDNEQTYFVIGNEHMTVGFKQIAGAVARRIRWYVREGETVEQGAEMGFIRFGSRIDVLIPVDMEVKVGLEELVSGGITVLAALPEE